MIAHIIHRDKFTNGYVKFMTMAFQGYEHVFFTSVGKYYLEMYDNIHEMEKIKTVLKDYYSVFEQADCIIVSGVWCNGCFPDLLKYGFAKKTYFHFWGGDFYRYRKVSLHPKALLVRAISLYVFRKAAGLCFLIQGEYEMFNEITHVTNKHFIAPMVRPLEEIVDYSKYRIVRPHDTIRIIVGNSASETNRHEDVFKILGGLDLSNVEIYCPLSYGNENYKQKVLEIGRKMLGTAFYPITDYMERNEYFEFLSSIDIGIFYNDRQQAMGNINFLLGTGKKVYLCPNTSMWNNYKRQGYCVYSAEDLKTMSFNDLITISDKDRCLNIEISDSHNTYEEAERAWQKVFNDSIN